MHFHWRTQTKSELAFRINTSDEHADLFQIRGGFTAARTQEIRPRCFPATIRSLKRQQNAVTRSLPVRAAARKSSLLHPACAWIKQTILPRCRFLHTVTPRFTDDLPCSLPQHGFQGSGTEHLTPLCRDSMMTRHVDAGSKTKACLWWGWDLGSR